MNLAEEIANELRPLLQRLQKDKGPRPGAWGHLEELLSKHFASLFQRALAKLITNIETLVQQWLAHRKEEGQVPFPTVAQSAEDFMASVHFDDTELAHVLREAQKEAWIAGGKDGSHHFLRPIGGVVRASQAINWETWKPGAVRAADTLVGTGFEDILAENHITLKGIEDTVRKDIAKILEETIRNRLGSNEAAKRISALLNDPFRARRIAVTEINRAMSRSTHKVFQSNGTAEWDLLTARDPCPICAAIKAGNPHPISDHHIPPYHPLCRCSLAPHVP